MAKGGIRLEITDGAVGESLLLPSSRKGSYTRCASHAGDELRRFRSCLRWMCVDQSDWLRGSLSWGLFLALGIAVPLVSHYVLSYSPQRHPYDAVVQFSLTAVAGLSFLCLSAFVRHYGLRRFLYLDKLRGESEKVRLGYTYELNLASVELVTGILICLRSAVKITHKAQAIKSHAAKWHVCATIDSFNDGDPEIPSQPTSNYVHPTDESDDEFGDEDELEDTKLVQPNNNAISFQKRQALVTYLENNTAGITVFGFMLDRSYLYMIFGLEFSMVLWLLGKTVGIS